MAAEHASAASAPLQHKQHRSNVRQNFAADAAAVCVALCKCSKNNACATRHQFNNKNARARASAVHDEATLFYADFIK